ncbi:MAG: hypothetical protein KAH20_06970 [Methylococcales bacterium]|nr:hypothetical protein [Methylococcales bacterium]
MKKKYSIEARSYDLMSVASHNFWVLRNDRRDVVAQLHGLATDRENNCFKPIGFFSDRLGFYEFKTVENDPTFISKTQQFMTVYEGDKDDVLDRWNKAVSQIVFLNQRDINYSPFGVLGFPITNSNSAYHLFAQLMDIECCRFFGVLEPGINNSLSFCH